MKTQNEDVIEYIEQYGSISDKEAYIDLGIRRLASRVCDLRKMGYPIIGEDEPHVGKNGRKGYHTRYKLEKSL